VAGTVLSAVAGSRNRIPCISARRISEIGAPKMPKSPARNSDNFPALLLLMAALSRADTAREPLRTAAA
jgi:hypothetical protein